MNRNFYLTYIEEGTHNILGYSGIVSGRKISWSSNSRISLNFPDNDSAKYCRADHSPSLTIFKKDGNYYAYLIYIYMVNIYIIRMVQQFRMVML